ncbi:spore germination protein [Sporosarcina sp. Marseille-Q4063]|uniref:spore germination protein n=1 Tax=Sporosarcina sp. Marseille-Q4063 TaxID=2810514 RepID=UPI001BAF1FB6|nr:spore germination protein [Sporosarcina sp. Marseille-Q4063]QUW23848.1 spore germination protein [Sporosarcina sp. Marseille-Q4063]
MFRKKSKPSSAQKQSAAKGEKNNEANTKKKVPTSATDFIQSVSNAVHNSSDLMVKSVPPELTFIYIDNLVDNQTLNNHILQDLSKHENLSPENIPSILSIPHVELADELEKAVISMMDGSVLIHLEGHSTVVLANIPTNETRSLSAPEMESQVIGSQVAFNESLSTNVSLIRRYIKNPNLCNENLQVGKQSNTSIAMLYIKGVASDEMVKTLRQRITDLETDSVMDSSILEQLIDDNSFSIFPQMLLTERPDKVCAELLFGKIAVIVDGSSMVIVCPHSFLEFLQSQEDQNVRWQIATFLRLLRFSAVVLSIFLTPLYVAALTYHYEVIPQTLLVPLSESRALVPFPPIFEALLLEIMIELLREAGIRLPTKVGQTIGIVGGIVIGTAAVDAGITSNILIIIVAIGALASFTTPSYMMGNVIRVIRFPLIVFAGLWGFYGIMLGLCFILVHLLRQSSLGSPYTAPFYPPRLLDWRDSLIRLPFPLAFKRPSNTRPEDEDKYEPEPINPENEQKVN